MGCYRERWTAKVEVKTGKATRRRGGKAKPNLPQWSLVGSRLTGEDSGVCGAYLVKRASEKATSQYVFKPSCEEAPAGMKRSVVFGDAAAKEVAVFALDHGHWAGVPFTTVGKMELSLVDGGSGSRVLVGSLQHYIAHECCSENMGSSCFPLDDVHRIGLLDCRILNLDRHEGNILVRKHCAGESVRLVPIDHGFSLPSWRDLGEAYFCWQSWSQASEPFSEDTKAYVAKLTPFDDIVPLTRLGVRPDSIVTYILCSLAAKYGVSAGLTLSDLAVLMQRDLVTDEPSPLERMVSYAASKTGFDSECSNKWLSPTLNQFIITFVQKLLEYVNSVKPKQ